MIRYGLILLCLLWTAGARAETFAVPTEVEWSDSATSLAQHETHRQAFELALTLVRRFSPADKGADVKGKRLVILNTTSQEMADTLAKFSTSKETDAFTMTGTVKGKEAVIVVTLLWDRLGHGEVAVGVPLANQGGVLVREIKLAPRPDVATRASVALAHELFGNVQAQLELDINNPKPLTKAGRREMEIRSFTEGVKFIDRVSHSPLFQNAEPSLQQHFAWARDREMRGLKSWVGKNGTPCRFEDLGG